MKIELEENKIRLEPSDWRWSATIVGLVKYFDEYDINYDIEDEFIEFNEDDITDEKYLLFVEKHFSEMMHHKKVEEILEGTNLTEEVIKIVNEKLSKNTSSNTIMLRTFKGIKFDGTNSQEIKDIIEKNRMEIISKTFKGGRALYYNFCNENNMLADTGKSCRVRGYSVDMGKKSKSVCYMRDHNTFVYQDSKLFDFIPFAFSKTREAFFVNNNFTIEQLIRTNKNSDKNDDEKMRSKLFFKAQDSSSYIDYDVEIIKKEREKDYFETLILRKDAIKIFEKIKEKTLEAIAQPCNIKRSEKGQDIWLDVEKIAVDNILNTIKMDNLIDKLLKGYNNHQYLIAHLLKINDKLYEKIYKEAEMTEKQKGAYASAMEVRAVLSGRSNKIRAYEQRLISAITLKDYDRVQEILLHLSAFTQVKMNFLIDLFENFEKNKNLAYTFINTLGTKKRANKKGDVK